MAKSAMANAYANNGDKKAKEKKICDADKQRKLLDESYRKKVAKKKERLMKMSDGFGSVKFDPKQWKPKGGKQIAVEHLSAIVGDRIPEFKRKMGEVNAIGRNAVREIKAQVDANTQLFQRAMAKVWAMARALNGHAESVHFILTFTNDCGSNFRLDYS